MAAMSASRSGGLGATMMRLPGLAAELVAKGVGGHCRHRRCRVRARRAARKHPIPVVFTIGGDPVRFGQKKGGNCPGGNVTGVLFNQNVLAGKRVELLKEVAPRVTRVALLMQSHESRASRLKSRTKTLALKKLGLETIALLARNAQETDAAFEQLLERQG